MSNTTDTLYWTLTPPRGTDEPPITMCEEHALEGTNIASAQFGLGPFDSMTEAALILEALWAMLGPTVAPSPAFETSELGHCKRCQILAEREGGGAA